MPPRIVSNERGATLVQVAISILVLMAMSGFVIDQGIRWVARGQAQNAADAGAMAGMVARIYDDTSANPPTGSGKVYESIVNTVAVNPVWGDAPPASTVGISWDCPDGTPNCVKVDVYRDGTLGSAELPTYFFKLVGTMSQKVKATATARIAPANTADCVKPWMVPDRWTNLVGGPEFNAGDLYIPPDQVGATGYKKTDIGERIELRLGDPSVPSFYQRADLDASGDVGYRTAIPECVGDAWSIGDDISSQNGKGSIPEQNKKMKELFDQDPNARWDGTKVINSCAETHTCDCGACANGFGGKISPLIVYVPLIDPADAVKSGKFTTPIVNILPFFISPTEYNTDPDPKVKGTIVGYLTSAPGRIEGSGSPGEGAFLNVPVLFR